MWTIPLLIFLSISVGVGAWLFFLWAVRSGQFEDIEGPKHRMLDDDEDEGGEEREATTPDSGPLAPNEKELRQ